MLLYQAERWTALKGYGGVLSIGIFPFGHRFAEKNVALNVYFLYIKSCFNCTKGFPYLKGPWSESVYSVNNPSLQFIFISFGFYNIQEEIYHFLFVFLFLLFILTLLETFWKSHNNNTKKNNLFIDYCLKILMTHSNCSLNRCSQNLG